jgi:flagellar assembly factor FliW
MSAIDVEFAHPLPGLNPHTFFALEPLEGTAGIYALRAKSADVRLFLLDVSSGDYGYEPPLNAGTRAEIAAESNDDVRVLLVANPSDDGIYLNLRAPILVHRSTGRASQLILEDQKYPIRQLLGS